MSRVYGLGSTGVVLASVLALAVFASGDAFAQAPSDVTITPPDNIVVEATGYFTPVDVGAASATSSSGNEPRITNNAPEQFLVGDTHVHWLARDDGGGVALAIQVVTVQDTTPPEFAEFPPYAKFLTNSSKKIPIEFGLPRATDLADIDVQVQSSHKPGSKFPVGNTTVTFTATDDSGNSKSMDVTVMVIDTRPKIQNVKTIPYHDRIHVSWDYLNGHTKYRAIITEVATGEIVGNHNANSNTQTFMNLKPGTDYKITVFAAGDKSTKVTVEVSTLPTVLATDDFASGLKWGLEIGTNNIHNPKYFNDYQITINTTEGRPAPSAEIRGDGYLSPPRIYRVFDLTEFEGDDLFIKFDYRVKSLSADSYVTNALIAIFNHDLSERIFHERMVAGGTKDSGWNTFDRNIGSVLDGTESITVRIGFRDDWTENYEQTAYFDNFYLGTVPESR